MRAVEADDPARNRCGCFLPDLTRLATAPSADFRAGIWAIRPRHASCADRRFHLPFTSQQAASMLTLRAMLPLLFLAASGAAQTPPASVSIAPRRSGGRPFISPM